MRLRTATQHVVQVVEASAGAEDHDPRRCGQLFQGIFEVIAVPAVYDYGWSQSPAVKMLDQVLLGGSIRIITF